MLSQYRVIAKALDKPARNTPNKNLVWGIDVSHHQSAIQWDVLTQKNQPDFIFFKATEGRTHVDTKYAAYSRKSRELGIPTGAYHFFSYQSSGKAQAANFIKHAKLRSGDLFPVLDVEFRKNMQHRAWIIREIKAFCQEINNQYGVYPIIYCECDYYHTYLKHDFADFHYWIADFYREPRCEYVIWQYTDRQLVHGIGKIDNNRWHNNKHIADYLLP
jgi:lysozyme